MYIENILMVILLSFVSFTSYNLLQFLFLKQSLYFGQVLSSTEIFTLFTIINVSLVFFGLFNGKFENGLLKKFPMLYTERKILSTQFLKILGYIFVFQVLETFYFWTVCNFVLPHLRVDGYNLEQNSMSEVVFMSLIVLHVWRMWICSNYMASKYQISLFLICFGGYLISIISRSSGRNKASSVYMLSVLNYRLALAIGLALAVPMVIQYVAIIGIKARVIHPLIKVILDKFES
jgi:hypothetical protein